MCRAIARKRAPVTRWPSQFGRNRLQEIGGVLMPGWRVGIDIGGTFTDVVGMEIETGKILVTKVPSIPADPSRAVAAGLQNLMETHPQIKAEDIDFFAHGTTVATNATIEGKGAKSGLLITKGFRAIYDMRGGNRPMGPDLIDTHWRKPTEIGRASCRERV